MGLTQTPAYTASGGSAGTVATTAWPVQAFGATWIKKSLAIGDITGLGAVKNGVITIATCPRNSKILFAAINVGTAESHLSDLLGSIGTETGSYIDCITTSGVNLQTLGNYIAVNSGTPMTSITSGDSGTSVYLRVITTDGSHNLADALAFVGTTYVAYCPEQP